MEVYNLSCDLKCSNFGPLDPWRLAMKVSLNQPSGFEAEAVSNFTNLSDIG